MSFSTPLSPLTPLPPTQPLTIYFTIIDSNYISRPETVYEIISEMQLLHHCIDLLIRHVRSLHPASTLLYSANPLKLFLLPEYPNLDDFLKQESPRERIRFLAEKAKLELPSLWQGWMNVVVMVQGSTPVDFERDKNPVKNTYPAALRRGPSTAFTLADLDVNGIDDAEMTEIELNLKEKFFKKICFSQELYSQLSTTLGDCINEIECGSDLPPGTNSKLAKHLTIILQDDLRAESYSDLSGKEETVIADFMYWYHQNFKLPCYRQNFPTGLEPVSTTREWPNGRCLRILFGESCVTYSPKSDMGVWDSVLPLWSGEICSDDKARELAEPDFYRMLFQGAGLVKFVNWVQYGLGEMKQPGFIAPLVYIDRRFWARIYVMREDLHRKKFLYSHIETCRLETDRGAVRFWKFLYNVLDQPPTAPELRRQLTKAWDSIKIAKSTNMSMSYAIKSASPSKKSNRKELSISSDGSGSGLGLNVEDRQGWGEGNGGILRRVNAQMDHPVVSSITHSSLPSRVAETDSASGHSQLIPFKRTRSS